MNDMTKYLILTVLLFTSKTLANSEAVPIQNEKHYYLNKITGDNPKMKTVFQNEKVQKKFNECFDSEKPEDKSADSLLGCVWEGDKERSIQGLDNETREQISEFLSDGKIKEEQGSDERYKQLDGLTKSQNQTYLALKNFYGKRLEEALYGKAISGSQTTQRMAEQDIFFDLQKTQLGKNIVASMTSFCLDARHIKNKDTYISLISDDDSQLNETRKMNLNNLSKKGLIAENTQTNLAYSEWSHCIQNIQHMCYQKSFKELLKNDQQRTNDSFTSKNLTSSCQKIKNPKTQTYNTEKECESILMTTKSRACEVTNYVESARSNLGAIDKVKSQINKNFGPKQGVSVGVQFYRGSKDQGTIDNLTSITSKDIADVNNPDSFAMANKRELDEFHECYKEGKLVNPEACKKYLNTNKEEALKSLVDMKAKADIRAKLLSKLIDEEDPEKAKQVLMQDGYTEDEAMAIIEKYKEDPSAIVSIVKERYETRTKEIIKNMAREIDKISVEEIKEDPQTLGALNEIESKLKKKTNEFAQLVHFNNIVSSYLQVTDGDEKSQNIASAKRELENNIFGESSNDLRKTFNSELAGNDKDSLLEITDYTDGNSDMNTDQNVRDTLEINQADEESNAVLNVSDINKAILNFFKQADQEQDK